MGDVVKSLPDCFMHIGPRRKIQEPLVCFRILHDGSCAALYRQHHACFSGVAS